MSEKQFDTRVADVYVDHLAAVSQHNEVLAQEDIYNEFGVLLLAKGSSISNTTAARLSNHTLTKPVDEVVRLTHSINNQTLLDEFKQLFTQNSDFSAIQKLNDGDDLLRHLCVAQPFPLPLLQKLTVLKDRFPEAYQRTLFGAWFSGLVAKGLKWSKDDAHDAFSAALFQDLGLLHIPIDVVSLTQNFSAEQWRAIQSHVIISSIIVDNLNSFSKQVVRAIIEHHERQDGAGYPAKKNADQLCEVGQLVGLSDLIFRLLARSATADKAPSFNNVLSYLKINNRPELSQVYSGALAVIKRAQLSALEEPSEADKATTIKRLKQRSDAIRQLYDLSQQFPALFEHIEPTKNGRTLLILVEKIKFAYTASGFFHDGFFDDLEAFSAEELADADQMQVELSWIIKRIVQSVPPFIASELAAHPALCESLNTLTEKMMPLLKSVET